MDRIVENHHSANYTAYHTVHNPSHNTKFMKKFIIPIISITILLTGIIGWQKLTYSGTNIPYPDAYSANPGHMSCLHVVANEIMLMNNGWQENRQTMLDQEKPTSEIVDEAFESMRTYRCWLDYLCEGVLFSGNADPLIMIDQTTKEPLTFTWEHIDKLPGCTAPENVEIPGTKLKYLEQCHVGREQTIATIYGNYISCRKLVNLDFTELEESNKSPSKIDLESFKQRSKAFIGLERDLKVDNGKKKNRALQNKLSSILNKMMAMESHMELLKQHLFKFDAMLPCLATKCD